MYLLSVDESFQCSSSFSMFGVVFLALQIQEVRIDNLLVALVSVFLTINWLEHHFIYLQTTNIFSW